MSVRRPFSSPDNDNAQDPFAEFVSEPEVKPEPEQKTDWFAEFPDETTTPAQKRSKNWMKLSDSVTEEKP